MKIERKIYIMILVAILISVSFIQLPSKTVINNDSVTTEYIDADGGTNLTLRGDYIAIGQDTPEFPGTYFQVNDVSGGEPFLTFNTNGTTRIGDVGGLYNGHYLDIDTNNFRFLSGNVGIGMTPAYQFHVASEIGLSDTIIAQLSGNELRFGDLDGGAHDVYIYSDNDRVAFGTASGGEVANFSSTQFNVKQGVDYGFGTLNPSENFVLYDEENTNDVAMHIWNNGTFGNSAALMLQSGANKDGFRISMQDNNPTYITTTENGIIIRPYDNNVTIDDTLEFNPRASAPTNPTAGQLYYNSGNNNLYLYDGSWVDLTAAASGNPFDQDLNTTDYPTFAYLNLTKGLCISSSGEYYADSLFEVVHTPTGEPFMAVKANGSLFLGDMQAAYNGQYLVIDGNANNEFQFRDGDVVMDYGLVVNEEGLDKDIRFESNTKTHAFFMDGTNGNIGINQANPDSQLDIDNDNYITPKGDWSVTLGYDGANTFFETASADSAEGLLMQCGGAYDSGIIHQLYGAGYASGWPTGLHIFNEANEPTIFKTNNITRMTITGDGNLSVAGNILPATNNTYTIGNETLWWNSSYFGSNTVYIGGIPLSEVNGNLQWGSSTITTNGSASESSSYKLDGKTIGNWSDIFPADGASGGILRYDSGDNLIYSEDELYITNNMIRTIYSHFEFNTPGSNYDFYGNWNGGDEAFRVDADAYSITLGNAGVPPSMIYMKSETNFTEPVNMTDVDISGNIELDGTTINNWSDILPTGSNGDTLRYDSGAWITDGDFYVTASSFVVANKQFEHNPSNGNHDFVLQDQNGQVFDMDANANLLTLGYSGNPNYLTNFVSKVNFTKAVSITDDLTITENITSNNAKMFVYSNKTQSFVHTVPEAVNWQTVRYDVGNGLNNTANVSRYYAPSTGYYNVYASVQFDDMTYGSGAYVGMLLYHNGSTYCALENWDNEQSATTNTVYVTLHGSTNIYLEEGDYIEIVINPYNCSPQKYTSWTSNYFTVFKMV